MRSSAGVVRHWTKETKGGANTWPKLELDALIWSYPSRIRISRVGPARPAPIHELGPRSTGMENPRPNASIMPDICATPPMGLRLFVRQPLFDPFFFVFFFLGGGEAAAIACPTPKSVDGNTM